MSKPKYSEAALGADVIVLILLLVLAWLLVAAFGYAFGWHEPGDILFDAIINFFGG